MNNEQGERPDFGPDLIRKFLQCLGRDVTTQELQETPDRVWKAWQFFTSGYDQDPAEVLKTFDEGYDELVFQSAIPFHSSCVVGSTFVDTPKGRIPIQYLKDGDWVYTVDGSNYEICLVKCRYPRLTRRRAPLVRVYADNDTVLCTPDHRFLTFNRGWVEARNLRPGDHLVSLYRSKWHTDKNLDQEPYVQLLGRRYDMVNEDTPKITFAGKTGIPEHRFVSGVYGRRPVHHINELRWDNSPDNLKIMTIGDHNRIHKKLSRYNQRGTPEYRRNREAVIASTKDPEVRKKRSKSVKAYWASLNEMEYQHRCKQTSIGIRAARNHVVLGVDDKVNWREDVWCMEIPNTHSFFANGMAVHNCAHHLLPFHGLAHIAYLPNGKIVGLSKLARLLEIFARRLTIQERIGVQVADALMEHLGARGAAVVLQCTHMCMAARGVQKTGTVTMTSAMRGKFMEVPALREEFMLLVSSAMQGIKTL